MDLYPQASVEPWRYRQDFINLLKIVSTSTLPHTQWPSRIAVYLYVRIDPRIRDPLAGHR
jgi:hypothetical protein